MKEACFPHFCFFFGHPQVKILFELPQNVPLGIITFRLNHKFQILALNTRFMETIWRVGVREE